MCVVKFESPINRLQYWAKQKPDSVYLTQPIGDQVITYSWSRVMDEVSSLANYLTKFNKGSHIAIFSLNCAHWIMADLAIQMAGHISIPIYPTASKKTIHKIIEHSETQAIFVGKLFDPLNTVELLPPELESIAIYQAHQNMVFYDDIVNGCEKIPDIHQAKSDDLMSIVYTSGTTGHPKELWSPIEPSMRLCH